MLMIVFLSKLDKLGNGSKEKNRYLYMTTDTSGYYDTLTDVVKQEIYLKTFFADRSRPRFKIATNLYVRKKKNPVDSLTLHLQSPHTILVVQPDSVGYRETQTGLRIALPSEFTKIHVEYMVQPGVYHQWIEGLVFTVPEGQSHSFWINSIAPPFGTRTWLLSKDTPFDKIDSLTINIQVPQNYTAISNGLLINKKEVNDSLVYEYESHYPTATYLIGLNIGQYESASFNYHSPVQNHDGFTVQLYFKHLPDEDTIRMINQRIEDILAFYEKILGPYPFEQEGLKIVEAGFHGGMENQTVIGVESISLEKEYLIAHEIAHHWFGDKITPEFSHSWLSEGFATYFTALYRKFKEGESSFRQYMAERQILEELPVMANVITFPDSVYDYNKVYAKGSWCIYQIHQWLGDDLFFEAVKKWLNQDQKKPVNLENFIQIFLNVPDGTELKNWFKKIVVNGYIPQIEGKLILKNKEYMIELENKDKRFSSVPIFLIESGGKDKFLLEQGKDLQFGPYESIEKCIHSLSSNLIKFHFIYP